MNKCKQCGSYAISLQHDNRDGTEPYLCNVCYWRKRFEQETARADTLQREVDGLKREIDFLTRKEQKP